jgi:hypothetical protein
MRLCIWGLPVSAKELTRRTALSTLAGVAASWLAGCNSTQLGASQPASSPPDVKIAKIAVDTSALLATQGGDPLGAWTQSSLQGALSKAFERYMAPGDPDGATLSVQISSVVLGASGAAGAIDTISGSATLSGGGAGATTVSLDATTTSMPSTSDRISPQPAHERRVEALAQAFATWLPRKLQDERAAALKNASSQSGTF